MATFEIENIKQCIVFGILFVVFPSCTSTLFYMFTAHFYGFGLLLSILSAFFFSEEKISGYVLSVICLACSIGIYQAYLPITITLLWFLVAKKVINNSENIDIIKISIKSIVIIIMGFATYLLILQICLKWKGVELSDYQGVNEMGRLSLSAIPQLLKDCYINFISLPFSGKWGIASTQVTKLGIVFVYGLTLILGGYLLFNKKTLFARFISIILVLTFPIAINFIYIMSGKSNIHSLMVYSWVLIYFAPVFFLSLFDEKKRKWIRVINKFIITLYCIISLNYAWLGNFNYVAMYYMNIHTENYLESLVTRVLSMENYVSTLPIYFYGTYFPSNSIIVPFAKYEKLYLDTNPASLINHYMRNSFIELYTGYPVRQPSSEQINAIKNSREILDMDVYPNDNSIKIIDEVIVVKLNDTFH